jgi:hypothetical protein
VFAGKAGAYPTEAPLILTRKYRLGWNNFDEGKKVL